MQKYKIVLETKEKIENIHLLSKGLNKQVVSWFAKNNEKIAEIIKPENGLKPVSIDFLKQKKENIFEFEIKIAQDNNLLDKELKKNLDEFEDLIDLNYKKFILVGYKKEDSISIKELFEKTPDFYSDIEFNFLTETSFVRRGINNEESLGEYPFPDPAKIFESIINKYNTFSEIKMDKNEALDYVNKYFFIKEANIKVNTFSLGYSNKKNTTVTGFTGNLILGKKTKDINISKMIAFLAKYGEWAGVGKKTFFGMGSNEVNFI
ncbi:MAG: CRISPR system precrRNA processing endoribonuclease RAMP protein Cas6 [Candidatus Sericytochromatia bacterium]